MSEVLEYIDAYFNNQLTQDERVAFEKKCVDDKAFAGEVAFYIATRSALKEQLLADKKEQWATRPVRQLGGVKKERTLFPQWARYAVAASLFVAAFFIFRNNNSPRQLAENYIKVHYGQLSQAMGDGTDSMALGKEAYNKKDFKKAEIIFTSIVRDHPDNAEATEFAGLVYIAAGNYNKAINYFGALASMKGLYSNPGLFLKAIAMILRNAPGDLSKAKGMLEEVVVKDLEGKTEAEKLLKKLK